MIIIKHCFELCNIFILFFIFPMATQIHCCYQGVDALKIYLIKNILEKISSSRKCYQSCAGGGNELCPFPSSGLSVRPSYLEFFFGEDEIQKLSDDNHDYQLEKGEIEFIYALKMIKSKEVAYSIYVCLLGRCVKQYFKMQR